MALVIPLQEAVDDKPDNLRPSLKCRSQRTAIYHLIVYIKIGSAMTFLPFSFFFLSIALPDFALLHVLEQSRVPQILGDDGGSRRMSWCVLHVGTR